jgi:hypothetical protein
MPGYTEACQKSNNAGIVVGPSDHISKVLVAGNIWVVKSIYVDGKRTTCKGHFGPSQGLVPLVTPRFLAFSFAYMIYVIVQLLNSNFAPSFNIYAPKLFCIMRRGCSNPITLHVCSVLEAHYF